VVRPYALVRGRTRPSGDVLDVVAMVRSLGAARYDRTDRAYRAYRADLEPEHLALLARCKRATSVADLSAALDLPLGVIRILVADLRDEGLVGIDHPRPERVTDIRLLMEVADGLRRL
jgi:uncharacterized protein DUF742